MTLTPDEYAQRIGFKRDPTTRIIHVDFTDCTMRTPADVAAFFVALNDKLAKALDPHDFVLCMDGLHVENDARKAYAEARVDTVKRYYRHAARYGGDAALRVTTRTSGVITGASSDVFATRQEAEADVLRKREAAAKKR